MIKRLAKAAIVLYKKTLSPLIGRSCIYTPTCSMYTLDAINKYGILGFPMGFLRICRCHPFAKGGFDPVKENLRGTAKWLI